MSARQGPDETVAANVDAVDAVGGAWLHCALAPMRLYEDTVRRFFATSAIYLSLPLTAGDVPVVRDESCEAGSGMAERHARRHRLMINREISIMLNTLLDEERTARGSIRSARLGADEVLMEARQRPETTVETWNSQHSASR